MNSAEIIPNLRKASDSPELARILAAFNVKKVLRMPKDDIDARISLPKEGLVLIFKPAEPKTSKLAFVAVQFVSEAEKGFKSFKGELPRALDFSDTAPDVIKKLGKPTEWKKQIGLQIWETSDQKMTVEYADRTGEIAMISVFAPEFY